LESKGEERGAQPARKRGAAKSGGERGIRGVGNETFQKGEPIDRNMESLCGEGIIVEKVNRGKVQHQRSKISEKSWKGRFGEICKKKKRGGQQEIKKKRRQLEDRTGKLQC